MNKNDLIDYSVKLRQKKDKLKKLVNIGAANNSSKSDYRIIIPRQLFETSRELESDMWYFNGFMIDCKGELIVVDPGVDFYSRFSTSGLSIDKIRSVIVTHSHIDHIASLQIILEKILKNKSKNVDLFISETAYKENVSVYCSEKITKEENIRIVLLKEKNGQFSDSILANGKITFLPLFHSVPETFGFKIKIQGKKIGYLSDSGYSVKVKTNLGVFSPEEVKGKFVSIEEKREEIKRFFIDVDLSVVNINNLHFNRHSKYHLSGWDILDIFKGSKVKKIILQHLSLINAEGEDSNYLYKLFFSDQSYDLVLPHYLGRIIEI